MTIQISERLKPFSHLPGAACLLPGTCLQVQAFPSLIRIGSHEIRLPVTGPVQGFTLQQDLEKNCVYVFGKAIEGYFRLRIVGSDGGIEMIVEKGPLQGVQICEEIPFFLRQPMERLSLGNHKEQDWDQVLKRFDLKELLPIFFCLAQKIPPIPVQPLTGTARLLNWPKERSLIAPGLEKFFKAAFNRLFIPRLVDDEHQGLVPDEAVVGNPFYLIQEGAKRVRELFFVQEERRLQFLPSLPIPLDCGRMIGVQALGIGQIDFEWSKKTLKRVVIRANMSGEILFDLPKELKSFRVNRKERQQGGDPLFIQAGMSYFIDQFQK